MADHEKQLLIGCVADDFTGAGDAASFLAAGGVRTVLSNGVPAPDAEFSAEFGAVVIALKSRTQETAQAVEETLAAFDWLRARGARTLYFKYCSTFDSTPDGNIGPVIDAVLERYGIPYTILCPALLANKRSVREGVLYVDGVPLAQSPMKNHPLTPMWESDIVKLMEPQGKYPCFKITGDLLGRPDKLRAQVEAYQKEHAHFYLCADYYEPSHGGRIAAAFHSLPFLTGGSGLLEDLAAYETAGSIPVDHSFGEAAQSARLLFAGSCSVATRGQVRAFLDAGGRGLMVSPARLESGADTTDSLWAQVQAHSDADLLVYSAGSGGRVERGSENSAALLERTLAELARRAVEAGCTRLICAGGETSGAVTQALGYSAFYIGKSVAPGVPVMVPTSNPALRLVLKSGNFGAPVFFLTTLNGEERRDEAE